MRLGRTTGDANAGSILQNGNDQASYDPSDGRRHTAGVRHMHGTPRPSPRTLRQHRLRHQVGTNLNTDMAQIGDNQSTGSSDRRGSREIPAVLCEVEVRGRGSGKGVSPCDPRC